MKKRIIALALALALCLTLLPTALALSEADKEIDTLEEYVEYAPLYAGAFDLILSNFLVPRGPEDVASYTNGYHLSYENYQKLQKITRYEEFETICNIVGKVLSRSDLCGLAYYYYHGLYSSEYSTAAMSFPSWFYLSETDYTAYKARYEADHPTAADPAPTPTPTSTPESPYPDAWVVEYDVMGFDLYEDNNGAPSGWCARSDGVIDGRSIYLYEYLGAPHYYVDKATGSGINLDYVGDGYSLEMGDTVYWDNEKQEFYFAGEGFRVYNGTLTDYDGGRKRVVVPARIWGGEPVRIGGVLFAKNTDITDVIIPEGITGIGGSAFSGCTGLTSITIPSTVTTIEESAFYGCTGLTQVTISQGVTKIKNNAFSGCTGLTSITIPESVTGMGIGVFEGCTGLTQVTLSSNMGWVENSMFRGCTGLTSLVLPEGVLGIGSGALSGCDNLTYLSLPTSLYGLGFGAFSGLGLTELHYQGTIAQWSALLASHDWAYTGNELIYNIPTHCIDGTYMPRATTAYATQYPISVDGQVVNFDAYALKDENGNDTNYIKIRDLASILNGKTCQFNVGWDGSVTITTGTPYQPNGSEMATPFSGNQTYAKSVAPTKINGQVADLDAITLTDANGGGYTYYKIRDLGKALGFDVTWAAGVGITIDTSRPYSGA